MVVLDTPHGAVRSFHLGVRVWGYVGGWAGGGIPAIKERQIKVVSSSLSRNRFAIMMVGAFLFLYSGKKT